MKFERLIIETPGRGLYPITEQVSRFLLKNEFIDGLVTLWVMHTSASLIVSENADPDVLVDHENFMSKLVPDGTHQYIHRDEGPDDMAAHIRSVLTSTSLTVPVHNGRMTLGTWQGIYLWEHRTHPHRRQIQLTWMTDGS